MDGRRAAGVVQWSLRKNEGTGGPFEVPSFLSKVPSEGPFGLANDGWTMAGLVAGLGQAAVRHVGAGIAVRAAHHASVRAEVERLSRPLAPGEALQGEGAAAVQPDLVLVPAAELVAAVVIDASALGYAMPVPRSKKKDRRAAAARVPPATLARRREGAVEPLSYESRALETQAVADALESAREAASEAPAPESSAPTAVA